MRLMAYILYISTPYGSCRPPWEGGCLYSFLPGVGGQWDNPSAEDNFRGNRSEVSSCSLISACGLAGVRPEYLEALLEHRIKKLGRRAAGTRRRVKEMSQDRRNEAQARRNQVQARRNQAQALRNAAQARGNE